MTGGHNFYTFIGILIGAVIVFLVGLKIYIAWKVRQLERHDQQPPKHES
jgi:uncharacterized membrane protein YdjX (TVP38/TMEM64 family)